MVLSSHSNQTTRKITFGLTLCLALTAAFITTGFIIKPPEARRQIALTSIAFKDGQPIPIQYTCDGKNISPPLAWDGAPTATKSFALIVDDPDSPTGVWAHWIVFDLSAEIGELPEGAAKSRNIGGDAKQGINDFKQIGYGGPCPPSGKQHRYYFKLYALDTTLDLKAGATKKDVEAAMAKHILAQGQLMGTYQRK